MIGYFDDLIFEVSGKKVVTISNVQRNIDASYEDHNSIGQKPQSEFLNPELDTVSFTIKLHLGLGVDPKAEADKWLVKCRSGIAGTLCIGVPIGVDKWTIRSISQSFDEILSNGKIVSCKMDVTLKEYTTNMWVNR